MLSGIVNVYKEKGYTSFDVVAKLRGILKMKKIGHTGTLDPDAEGVLPVCLGKATKVCELLTDKNKEYETVMLLGTVTDTQDISGKVLSEKKVSVTEQEVLASVESFVGNYMQTPPMYSALKIDGKKMCDLARAGITVERKARPVRIFSITVLKIELPRVWMRVECSKGTYIRTLCQDIGERLGCGGCMEALTRTKVADFCKEEALRLAQIEALVKEQAGGLSPENWKAEMFSFVQPVDSVFLQYEKAVVKERFLKALFNGNRIGEDMLLHAPARHDNSRIRIYDGKGNFAGIYEWSKDSYKPVKLFLE
ncbi:MAG: tRNA pseudouridine(55) synthase TruB [Roseburia sp.]